MTSKLTIEQAKRLRNDFECWQQDYDPKDDKEQYDMFGRGMAAMDMLIAGMYQEPVAWIVHARTGDQLTTDGSYVANAEGILCLHSTPLYRHAQQPVVPPMQHWEELCRDYPDMSIGDAIIRAAWWNHCRAAMLQAGNPPVIPEGYVMVPKDPTAEMVIKMRYHVGGYDRNIKEGYKAMLAAADCSIPMISDRWIPVSERVPTKQDGSVFLTWNGQYIGKELFLMGSFQCLKPEIITHWMPLPAPPTEVK
ncbi:DUF551 domain-containing protein [Klebsiella aerogenes]|nr:DUF551 domain-containing protein [Klebsiella aerogenes]